MNTTIKTISTGFLLALTIGSGFLLSYTGKPYSSALFNAHKLITVAAVVFTITISRSLYRTDGNKSLITAVLVLLSISVITLIASGAVMSIKDSAGRLFLTVHRIAPIIAVISTGFLLYLYMYRLK
jgi:hypothetical protein